MCQSNTLQGNPCLPFLMPAEHMLQHVADPGKEDHFKIKCLICLNLMKKIIAVKKKRKNPQSSKW